MWPMQGAACMDRGGPFNPSCEFVLWRSDADGGNARVVGRAQGDVRYPQWSRDGQRIVFHRPVDDTPETYDPVTTYEVFSMAGDGSDLRRLTFGGGTLDMQPAVSPDGREIAWWRSGFDASIGYEVGGIWLMGADGSNQRELVDLPGNESTPDFTADGSRVAFTRDLRRSGGVDIASVWSVRRDGADVRQLSRGDLAARVPKFSPDGRHVSFFSGNGLLVIALDGSRVHQYRLGGNTAAWSSDGRYLAVLGIPSGDPNGRFSLWRIDIRRPEAPPLLVRDLSAESGGWLAHPGWLADAARRPRADKSAPSFVIGLEQPGSAGPMPGSLRVPGSRRTQRPLTVRDPERLRFVAADRSGLRQVKASVTKAGTAARFRRVRNHRDWRRITRRLRRGKYVLRVRVRDARGNVGRTGRPVTLRVR